MRLDVIASGSKGNAYILQNGEEALLIEAGVKFEEIQKALDFNLGKVAGCLISHEHGDHAKYTDQVLKAGIEVFTSRGTAGAISTTRKPTACEAGKIYSAGNFRFIPFATIHDAAEPFGFYIHHPETGYLLFATDTAYLPFRFQGLNNIMIECNYSLEIIDRNVSAGIIPYSLRNRIIKSHFELGNLLETLGQNDLREFINVVLLHLSDNNSSAEHFREEVRKATGKKVFVADPGMSIRIDKTPF